MVEIIDIKKRKIDKKNEVRRLTGAIPLCNDCGKEIHSDDPWGTLPKFAICCVDGCDWTAYYQCKECEAKKEIERLKKCLMDCKYLLKAMYEIARTKDYPDYGMIVARLNDLGFFEYIPLEHLTVLYQEMVRD